MILRPIKCPASATFHCQQTIGLRNVGVPWGGAFDQKSYHFGIETLRSLGGNGAPFESVELPLPGGKFEVLTDAIVVITGAAAQTIVRGTSFEAPVVISVEKGDCIEISDYVRGCRTYLLATERCRQLASSAIKLTSPRLSKNTIRIVPGSHIGLFNNRSIINAEWSVSYDSNRVGIRLNGPHISGGRELTSEPACMGSIQITHAGLPIVIGPDGPTIGGYPQIAVVCSADLDLVGQLKPGEQVRFEWIDLEEAHSLWDVQILERKRELALLKLGIQSTAH